MRSRILSWILLVLLGGIAGVLTMTWTHGQPGQVPGKLPSDILLPPDPLSKAAVPPAVRPASGNTRPSVGINPPLPKPKAVPFDRFPQFRGSPRAIEANGPFHANWYGVAIPL